MEELVTYDWYIHLSLLGHAFVIKVNLTTFVTSLCIIIFLSFFSWLGTRKLSLIPSKYQALLEIIVETFDKLLQDTIGKKDGRKYLTFSISLFLFIFISNIVGIFPFGWTEPTRDLNVPFALALLTFFISNVAAIKKKGLWTYLKEYTQPFIIMLPLNIVGEIAKVISHSFRLYGNILGGAIIIAILSELTKYFLFPVFLNAFFGLFVGAIQAFVFTMLAITYIAVAIATDEEEEQE